MGFLAEAVRLGDPAAEQRQGFVVDELGPERRHLQGGVARAARLWGAAEALLETIEATAYAHAPDRALYERQVRSARAQLDEATWQAAWAQGRAMSTGWAIEYALSEDMGLETPTMPVALTERQPPPAGARTGALTPREREVALLVGRGLTNRRIAEELSISANTANNHVARILKKLGLSSRTQIAAWVTQRRFASSVPD